MPNLAQNFVQLVRTSCRHLVFEVMIFKPISDFEKNFIYTFVCTYMLMWAILLGQLKQNCAYMFFWVVGTSCRNRFFELLIFFSIFAKVLDFEILAFISVCAPTFLCGARTIIIRRLLANFAYKIV